MANINSFDFRLSLLVGKYESNALALKLALNCSDQGLQLSEALLCLLETELSLVLSNCRAPSSGHDTDDNRFLRRAAESRRKAERHAKELLEDLESSTAGGHHDWTPADELRLRDHLNRLKSERNAIKATVVELETPHVQPFLSVMTVSEARKLDLETAVLMQVRLFVIRQQVANWPRFLKTLEFFLGVNEHARG